MSAAATGESGARLALAEELLARGWRFSRAGAFLLWHPPFHHTGPFNTLLAVATQAAYDGGSYAKKVPGFHGCCESREPLETQSPRSA